MFYWVKTNKLIKWLFNNQIWSLPNKENKIYLTFDDGPTPEVTPWVLDILKQNNLKATFFCIGKNIQQNPEIFKRIIAEGHLVGNHTHNHLNGWKTNNRIYLENVKQCEETIQKILNDNNFEYQISNIKSKFFRPPYGKISLAQSKMIQNLGYKIIMWDVLTGDFDSSITPQNCLENAKKAVSGSIIVFHDSIKASTNLRYTLPRAIEYYIEKGLKFNVL